MGMLGGPAPASAAEADRWMREWLAEGDRFRDYLGKRYRKETGRDLIWAASELPAVLEFVARDGLRNRLTRGPAWGHRSDVGEALSVHGTALLDGAFRYYASLAHLHAPQQWALQLDPASPGYVSPRFASGFGRLELLPRALARAIARQSVAGLEPFLAEFAATPGRLSEVRMAFSDAPDPAASLLADGLDSLTLAERAVPVAGSTLVFAVQEPELEEFTYSLWVDEAYEHVCGVEAYAALEDRLAATPGVDEVMGEDRELVHVRTTLAPEAMLVALVEAALGGVHP